MEKTLVFPVPGVIKPIPVFTALRQRIVAEVLRRLSDEADSPKLPPCSFEWEMESDMWDLAKRAWRYYKIFGTRIFFMRLWNSGLDAAFGYAAPILRAHKRVPSFGETVADRERKSVFYLASTEWEQRVQRSQHIAVALARKGYRVHYIAPYSARSSEIGWRVTRKRENLWHVRLFSRYRESLAKLLDPEKSKGFADSLSGYISAVSKSGNDVILVQHPLWDAHLRNTLGKPIYYDCIDEHGDFADVPAETESCEQRLTGRCRGVICTAVSLLHKFDKKATPCVINRNACEYEHFVRPFPALHPGRFRKIIGYHGALAEWFDADLVARTARALPEHTFRLVGAHIPSVHERLASIPNVELIGEVEYRHLPEYVRTFDVALLPFKIRPLTMGTNPVKVYEYLAAGLPVVSVPLPEMEQFGDLVSLAEADDFISAVKSAVGAEFTEEEFAKRQSFARNETWDRRAERMIAFWAENEALGKHV
jgi:glycosyltransferase involved in cell wall biosynthesis